MTTARSIRAQQVFDCIDNGSMTIAELRLATGFGHESLEASISELGDNVVRVGDRLITRGALDRYNNTVPG